MEQRHSDSMHQIADLLERVEELQKRYPELIHEARRALDLLPRTLKMFSESGYEYIAKDGRRYRIWYSPPPARSMRTKGGGTEFYAAFDHFFAIAEGDADPPHILVVVPILQSVFRTYESKTGRSLTEDEEVRLGLCLDRIEDGLDRGIDLFEVSKVSVEPNASPLAVTREHLEESLRRI